MGLFRIRVAMVVATVLLVGCDHGSKYVAKGGLEHRPPHTLVRGIFDLDYTENRDTGFGLLRSVVPERIRTPALTSVQLLSGMAFLILGLRRNARRSTRLCLLLISAGAIGNGLDRLARGYVVDFLHLHYWPVFNLADIYITVGAVLLVLANSFAARSRGEKSPLAS
jgi:signal peptidase II